MEEERLERVKGRLTPELLDAVSRAVASGRMPRTLMEGLSPASIESFRRGGAPLEGLVPVGALEAIVQRFGRPPLVVRRHAVELESLPAELGPDIDVAIKGAEHLIPSVGRVEFVNARMSWGGTAWLTEVRGDRAIVVTNRHVAEVVARRLQDGSGVFLRNSSGVRCGARIDFNEEVDSLPGDASGTFRVERVRYLADLASADVALLEILSEGVSDRTPIELSEEEAKPGERVALIGYPAYDSRNDDGDQARYFRDLYEVKRFAPGLIMQAAAADEILTHDCTSLGGNSGSPLISLDREGNKAVGLHFYGDYGVENRAVSAGTIRSLLRGEMPAQVAVAVSLADQESRSDGHHGPEHFVGRDGFETGFLGDGVSTPWPTLPAALAAELATPGPTPDEGIRAREPNELRYTHFGVKYHSALRLPLLTAVNIDGSRSVRIKREADRWYTDGRLDASVQLNSGNYADPEIDRGHMVRREDPNWAPAETPGDAQLANDDTFHFTNAAPQHSRLNQGKTLWQGLENYILDNARTHGFRACVFTGPVLRPEGEEELRISDAVVPLEFWKVVCTVGAEDGRLRATAYLLSQGQLIRKLMEDRARRENLEGFEFGEYRTFQLAVRDLAAATGYDFGPFAEADPLAGVQRGREALSAGEPLFLDLQALNDVVL